MSSAGGAGAPARAHDEPRRGVPVNPSTAAGGGAGGAGGWSVRGWLMQVSVPGRVVGCMAVLSAVAAVVLKHTLFPHLSIDDDEALYRLQAQTFAAGHLFPPAPHPAGSFTPWLAAVRHGHYVLKYTPVVPALLAASLVVTGGTAAALAGTAAAAVVMTYLLGVEVLAERRAAAVAAVLLAISPLVVVQSALLLPYLPVLVLFELAVYGVLRALRRGHRVPLVGAGVATGLAAAVRPYDAILFLAPTLVWLVLAHRRRLWWVLRWVALGLVPPAALLLSWDAAATGSPFRLPFAFYESQDKLGFGVRRLYPADRHNFGIVEGLAGVGNHLYLLGGWAFCGVVLLGFAIAAVARRRVGGPGIALGAGALALLVGYIGFWGAWNAADLWGGIRYVGPFYMMPVMIPLVILGARGLVDLWDARPAGAALAMAAGAVATGFAFAVALPADATFTHRDGQLAALITHQASRPVVLVDIDPTFLMHPSAMVANGPDLDGTVVYAVMKGSADLDVVAGHPGRPAYALRISGSWNHRPGRPSVARLERLTTVAATRVTFDLQVRPPVGSSSARILADVRGVRSSYPIDGTGFAELTATVDQAGLVLSGPLGTPTVTPSKATADGSAYLGLYATSRATGKERLVDHVKIAVQDTAGGQVLVLAPDGQVGAVGTTQPAALEARLR